MTTASHGHFNDYTPADFGWGTRDPRANAGLLVPFSHSGVSFGSMHRDVVGLFTALLDELVPLIPGGLVAGTCGCYNPRSVTVGGDRSFHTYAIAIDVNWSANPMYAKSHPTGPHTLPLATSAIAKKYGCEWGGDWSYPQDWMHIECHLSPADAQSVHPHTGLTLEEIVALDRTSPDYKAFVADVGTAVWQHIINLPDPAKDAPAAAVLANTHATVHSLLKLDQAQVKP